ncbi:CLUMA_CG011550, isoform A [Clunio marinus]|uniref:CLUMA_CG011550, isoform A n=1 Tax=Clunio marinus TaxID=568069 RepID=A0A1J1IIA8_9DIPT|nr:CLUMA_CG011550, isoform A [Clunio marinus]
MMRFLNYVLISFLLKYNYAAILVCEYKRELSDYGSAYTCDAQNFQDSFENRNVTSAQGNHEADNSDEFVTKLFMKKQFCPYLPLNTGSIFPNLEIFYIMNSNVKHLLKGDLDGLNKLRTFDVSHNPIEVLQADFFKGHDTIEIISFYDCHLKLIDHNALNSLPKLRKAYFNYNVCIDYQADDEDMIESLAERFSYNCEDNDHQIFHSGKNDKSHLKEDKKAVHVEDKLPFVKSNAYWILFFLLLIIILLSLILLKTVTTKFGSNWIEFKNHLISGQS